MLKKFSVGGWCGRVIIVSALSQRKRVKRERELDNFKMFIECADMAFPKYIIVLVCIKII